MKINKIYMSDNELVRILPHETANDDKSGLAYISISVGSKNVLNLNRSNVRELIELLERVAKDYKI